MAPPASAGPGILRFMTCGSVDDGKSTLIGRLLHDSGSLMTDQLAALERDSRRRGGQEGVLDFSLLLDGLAAEREQGITIDVAYRFFGTARRRFIVADAPGHEQYTRNMATGASSVDLAVLLVDARKGVLTQTRRHAYIAQLMGVRRLVLAVNKMDLVDWSQARFEEIVDEFRAFAAGLQTSGDLAVPLCAAGGDNVARPSPATPWYAGPTLLENLETVDVSAPGLSARGLRFPVQWVNRPNADFRGFSGLVVQGTARPGQEVAIAPSGRRTRIKRVLAYEGDLQAAGPGQAVTIQLEDEVDCARGDQIVAASDAPEIADQLEADIVWMSDEPALPGRAYLLKCATKTLPATILSLKHKVNINTLEPIAARRLELNDVGRITVSLDQPIPFEPFEANRDLGGFILIDRATNATLAGGMIRFALRRSHNIRWQALEVDKTQRARLLGQRPRVLWFTGLSGAGKSTIADLVERRLHAMGRLTYTLDGDNLRHGLNRDLGFTETDRVENIRRVAEVARLMADAGLIVLCCFISPYREDRRMAKDRIGADDFLEIFVDTPLAEAEGRDVKGLYAKARRGDLKNFTGIDSPYEPPLSPDIRIDTLSLEPAMAAEAILADLLAREAAEALAEPQAVEPGGPTT